jgi:hypothetical protein
MFKIKLAIALFLLLQGQFSLGQSAIGQLENMTGQKINRYNTSNSSGYDMNSMISGMIAQSMVNSIFNSNKSNVPVKEVKVQTTYLLTQISGEKQQVEQTLRIAKYNRLMKAYKFLKDSSALAYSAFNSKKTDLVKMDSAFLSLQQKLINDRLKYDNDIAKKYLHRLAGNVPELSDTVPGMKLKNLKPGDVLLFEPGFSSLNDAIQGLAVVGADGVGELLGAGTVNESKISHTITFLREENGKRFYMDNMPNEGPVIIDENEMKRRYVGREASVAQLQKGYMAQPLNEEEANKLWDKANEMSKQNLELRKNNDFNSDLIAWENSLYGAWGKDNVVCSEASWALIKSTGRDLPLSKSWITRVAGVDFSPSDFYNYKQSFLINKINITE